MNTANENPSQPCCPHCPKNQLCPKFPDCPYRPRYAATSRHFDIWPEDTKEDGKVYTVYMNQNRVSRYCHTLQMAKQIANALAKEFDTPMTIREVPGHPTNP